MRTEGRSRLFLLAPPTQAAAQNILVPNRRWKIHEACMLSLGSVKTIITENVKNGRIQFDMHGFLAGVILADLNLAGERQAAWSLPSFQLIHWRLEPNRGVSPAASLFGLSLEQRRRRSCWAEPCGRPVASRPPCHRTSSSSSCRPPSAASTTASRPPSASRRSEPSGGEWERESPIRPWPTDRLQHSAQPMTCSSNSNHRLTESFNFS